jgi:putative ABC transport system permease protein
MWQGVVGPPRPKTDRFRNSSVEIELQFSHRRSVNLKAMLHLRYQRDGRVNRWIHELGQDVSYALRMLRKSPGFAAVSVLILSLGIGVTTAMFSLIYGVLIDPYPYEKANEIWAPEIRDVKTGRGINFTVGDYLEISKLPAVESAMATSYDSAILSGEFDPYAISSRRITGTAFPFLGVAPVAGRTFTPADIKPSGSAEPVAVLTFKLWLKLYHGSRDAIGRTIILNDEPYEVIGVMPERFGWYTDNGLWMPLSTTDLKRQASPIFRLKPGVTKEVAEQQLLALFRRLAREDPGRFPKDGFTAVVNNYLDVTQASGQMRASLDMLFCVVGILLLIACTNVANLQLARGTSRNREIAVRMALGAGRSRIVRQLLTESLGLSLLGGVAGVGVAYAIKQIVMAVMPATNIPNEARVTINLWVLAFSFGISVLTGILFGLAPALQSTRSELNDALKDGGHGGGVGGARGARTRNTLVVAEVALSALLLFGAGLAVRGFVGLQQIDRGFNPDGLSLLRVPLGAKKYNTEEKRSAFTGELLAGLQTIPGVTSTATGSLPGYDRDFAVTIPGQPKPSGGFVVGFVNADYFRTFGMGMRDGQTFTPEQVTRGDRVAVINESARKYWLGGSDPIGRTIEMDTPFDDSPAATKDALKAIMVIGVIADTRPLNPSDPPRPVAFVPYTLHENRDLVVFVRSSVKPESLFRQFGAELRSLDKEQPMADPWDVDQVLDRYVAQPRFNMTLFTGFAGIALALAAAGIYSVLSYSVTQRTREIGVRIALGAERGDILRLVFGSGGRMVVAGLVLGLGGSVALAMVLKSQVFGVPLLDPFALASSGLLLCAAAALACLVPARRAAGVNPLVALRCD